MDFLRQAAQAVLDAYDQHDPIGVVVADLRAALAQPERTPLTDDQIAEICMDCSLVTPSDIYFARAIEKAHGIK